MEEFNRAREIRLTNHTLKRISDRGISREVLEDAVRSSGRVIREATVFRIERVIEDKTLVVYVKAKADFNLVITYWIQ